MSFGVDAAVRVNVTICPGATGPKREGVPVPIEPFQARTWIVEAPFHCTDIEVIGFAPLQSNGCGGGGGTAQRLITISGHPSQMTKAEHELLTVSGLPLRSRTQIVPPASETSAETVAVLRNWPPGMSLQFNDTTQFTVKELPPGSAAGIWLAMLQPESAGSFTCKLVSVTPGPLVL